MDLLTKDELALLGDIDLVRMLAELPEELKVETPTYKEGSPDGQS